MTRLDPTLRGLVELVGQDAVRSGEAFDAVADLVPALVVSPSSADEVASVLRTSQRHGWAVVIRGMGTKRAWGAPARRCDIVLDTTRLNRLVEYEPGDLICVAGAGMTLGELQTVAAGAGNFRQRLMLDPPQGNNSTLGGLVATRAAGPLRTRFGTMRDLLLGAQFVLPDGTVARTGGKVVKNVAGYDLDKLLVGSLGSLAVLVEVAIRLQPVADSSRMVLLESVEPREAADFVSTLRRAPAVPSVVEVLWPERAVLVRVDSSNHGAARQAEQVAALNLRARIVDESEIMLWERRLARRPWQGEGTVVGISLPHSGTSALLSIAEEHAGQGSLFELSLRGLIGVGEARLASDPELLRETRDSVEALGGQLELHRAPPALGLLGSTPSDPVARQLMSAIKQAFDPGGILPSGPLGWAAG